MEQLASSPRTAEQPRATFATTALATAFACCCLLLPALLACGGTPTAAGSPRSAGGDPAGSDTAGGNPASDNPKCQPVTCELACEGGFAQDANGCDICSCAAACEPVTCELYCEDGFATRDGCEVCVCK